MLAFLKRLWHYLLMTRAFDSATCPACNSYLDRLPVDGDEDGAYVALPVAPCTECGAFLCVDCPQFTCESCDQRFCQSHVRLVVGGSNGEVWKCCPECAAEFERQDAELPAAIPPQIERVLAFGVVAGGKVVA